MSSAIVTCVELVTHIRVLMVKDAIGSGALGINASLGLLLKLPVFAVHIVGQDTFLPVPDSVIKEESIRAEVGLGHIVLTDVVQVTLLWVSKESILF